MWKDNGGKDRRKRKRRRRAESRVDNGVKGPGLSRWVSVMRT